MVQFLFQTYVTRVVASSDFQWGAIPVSDLSHKECCCVTLFSSHTVSNYIFQEYVFSLSKVWWRKKDFNIKWICLLADLQIWIPNIIWFSEITKYRRRKKQYRIQIQHIFGPIIWIPIIQFRFSKTEYQILIVLLGPFYLIVFEYQNICDTLVTPKTLKCFND